MVWDEKDTPGAVDCFVKKSLAIAAGQCYTVDSGEKRGFRFLHNWNKIISQDGRKVNGFCGIFLRCFAVFFCDLPQGRFGSAGGIAQGGADQAVQLVGVDGADAERDPVPGSGV